MSDPLQTYLHDHLAGSRFAVELLEALRDQEADASLAQFAKDLLVEVGEDVGVLRGIIDRVGESSFDFKQAAAWLAEKASRLKLQHGEPRGLGTFETLETLSLGILGKLALWRALAVVSEVDVRVPKLDFGRLCHTALDQHSRVEACRIKVARQAFAV